MTPRKPRKPAEYADRSYRRRVWRKGLTAFQVKVSETDLMIQAAAPLEELARERSIRYRGQIESYIDRNPEFRDVFSPWMSREHMAPIVRDMAEAGARAGVGPMAAVAGAIAARVGKDLLAHSPEVIVENGGDIFLKVDSPVTVALFAGASTLSMRIGVRLETSGCGAGVCTSSGTVGHSTSFGKADAVCVVSEDCALADAAATAVGNRIRKPGDIAAALDFGGRIPGVAGIAVICGKVAGAWGKIELVRLGEGAKNG